MTAPGPNEAGLEELAPNDRAREARDVSVQWAPPAPPPPPRSAGWALTFAVLALAVSTLVGWGFLIGILGVILSLLALRRPWESRTMAVWALVLSLVSLLYSAGWLWFAASQGDLFA